jgi:putative pyruvate formate lyase activating enzyme
MLRLDSLDIFRNEKCRKSLRRYFGILEEKRKAQFIVSKLFETDYIEDADDKTLWRMHETLTKEYKKFLNDIDGESSELVDMKRPAKSYFDLKIAIAHRIMRNCSFCLRACRIDRTSGARGYCKCGNEIALSSAFDHWGEEPELVPSGTIFTCGCTMTCLHCQNFSISQWLESSTRVDAEELARVVEGLYARGCRNANLVGGDPTPWLQIWLEAFKNVCVNVPVVWNSNTYYSEETARLLAGFADVYLLDFKYGPGDCAERISNAPNYWSICTQNHLTAKMYGELIVRVLVLPGHLECCTKPILDWIAKNLGRSTRVNVMFQFKPEWRAGEVPELGRRLTGEERKRAVELARDARLDNYLT